MELLEPPPNDWTFGVTSAACRNGPIATVLALTAGAA
jgi:hypothetical protein